MSSRARTGVSASADEAASAPRRRSRRVLLGGASATVLALAGATAAVALGSTGTSSSPAAHRAMTTTAGSMPTPMPITPLGQAVWQGMKIQAIRMAPVTFGVFTGTKMQTVRKTAKDSFHLMVRLTDAHTGAPIPYSSVWATIRKGSKVVFDERQWPMLSASMGAHYGNNVALPGAGAYTLTLLIGPPQVARHPEYTKVWLEPHRVSFAFTWKPMK